MTYDVGIYTLDDRKVFGKYIKEAYDMFVKASKKYKTTLGVYQDFARMTFYEKVIYNDIDEEVSIVYG